MRSWILLGLSLASTACGSPEREAPTPAPALPGAKNVLLITLDGLRQDHISHFGYQRRTTPNIDWLTERGAALRRIIPTGCSTKTSLTSLYTASDYSRHRIFEHGEVLDDDHLTLAEIFAAHGYHTLAHVATPHLAAALNYDQGFDRYHDFTEVQTDYVRADQVARGALDDLERWARDPSAPFFAYLHFEEPHPPWIYGSPWLDEPEPARRFFDRSCTYVPSEQDLAALDPATTARLIAKYDAALSYADHWIGVLLATLRRLEVLRNTVVAVSTDHGIELLDRYSATHGYNPFDEVLRCFLVLYDGGAPIDPGPAAAAQGRIFDIGPTLLALAGIDPPAALQGVDLLARSEDLPPLAYATCYNASVARGLGHKLIEFDYSRKPASQKNRPAGIGADPLLFDLRADPGEITDIFGERPEIAARMQQSLAAYRSAATGGGTAVERIADDQLGTELNRRLRSLGYIE